MLREVEAGLRGTRGGGQVLVPLWGQLPSERARPPPQAESRPCGWFAAASVQPAPASPGVAGFCLQSITNKPKAKSHWRAGWRLVCATSWPQGFCFEFHKVKREARNKTAGQGGREREREREGDKGRQREGMGKGGLGRKWGREHS